MSCLGCWLNRLTIARAVVYEIQQIVDDEHRQSVFSISDPASTIGLLFGIDIFRDFIDEFEYKFKASMNPLILSRVSFFHAEYLLNVV